MYCGQTQYPVSDSFSNVKPAHWVSDYLARPAKLTTTWHLTSRLKGKPPPSSFCHIFLNLFSSSSTNRPLINLFLLLIVAHKSLISKSTLFDCVEFLSGNSLSHVVETLCPPRAPSLISILKPDARSREHVSTLFMSKNNFIYNDMGINSKNIRNGLVNAYCDQHAIVLIWTLTWVAPWVLIRTRKAIYKYRPFTRKLR